MRTTVNKLRVTRRALFRAFSSPARTHQQVKSLVDKYMADGAVPHWSAAGVRGVFGRRIEREWARHLRHRPATPGLHVQTAYDFGTTPEALAGTAPVIGELAAIVGAKGSRIKAPTTLIVDEYHHFA